MKLLRVLGGGVAVGGGLGERSVARMPPKHSPGLVCCNGDMGRLRRAGKNTSERSIDPEV